MKKPKSFTIPLENFIKEEHFFAIKNLEKGTASAEQQKLALKCIAENIGGLFQMSYEENNQANTAFNEGKRWVSRFLYEVVVAPVTYFKSLEASRQKQKPNINKL